MSELYRDLIYSTYINNTMGTSHNDKNTKYQIRYYKKNFARHISKDKSIKILELGCGMGEFYQFLRREGYSNYEGVDISEDEIEYIKKTIDNDVRIFKEDIFNFLNNSTENCYDVVVFNDCIEHLKKDEICNILIEIKRVLKDNGKALIKTPNMANPFVSTAGRYIGFDHEIGFTENSMREILRAIGYSRIDIKGTNIYVICPVINQIAWVISKIIGCILFLISALYGRTSLRIFEKDILAIAVK